MEGVVTARLAIEPSAGPEGDLHCFVGMVEAAPSCSSSSSSPLSRVSWFALSSISIAAREISILVVAPGASSLMVIVESSVLECQSKRIVQGERKKISFRVRALVVSG